MLGSGDWGVRILDFRFWIKELKFNLKDALYVRAACRRQTLLLACFSVGVRGLALSVGAASLRVAMPQALRCAIINSIIQI